MKTTRLLMDHHENTDRGLIVHKAGSTVSLPDQEVEYIHSAIIGRRKEIRKAAESLPCSPEWERLDR